MPSYSNQFKNLKLAMGEVIRRMIASPKSPQHRDDALMIILGDVLATRDIRGLTDLMLHTFLWKDYPQEALNFVSVALIQDKSNIPSGLPFEEDTESYEKTHLL